MEKELAKIVKKLLEEAKERETIANEILKAHGFENISSSAFEVHIYEGKSPDNIGRIEELAELFDSEAKVNEKGWKGFTVNGIYFFTIRDKVEENEE